MAKRQKKTRSNPTGAVCPDHPSAQQSSRGCTAKGCTFVAPVAPSVVARNPCAEHPKATQTANGCSAEGCTHS
jgi:hypothetical protein